MSSVQPKLLKLLKLHSWAYPLTGKSARCVLLAALLSHSHFNKGREGKKKIGKKILECKRRKQTRTQVRTRCIAIKPYLGHTCFKFKSN